MRSRESSSSPSSSCSSPREESVSGTRFVGPTLQPEPTSSEPRDSDLPIGLAVEPPGKRSKRKRGRHSGSKAKGSELSLAPAGDSSDAGTITEGGKPHEPPHQHQPPGGKRPVLPKDQHKQISRHKDLASAASLPPPPAYHAPSYPYGTAGSGTSVVVGTRPTMTDQSFSTTPSPSHLPLGHAHGIQVTQPSMMHPTPGPGGSSGGWMPTPIPMSFYPTPGVPQASGIPPHQMAFPYPYPYPYSYGYPFLPTPPGVAAAPPGCSVPPGFTHMPYPALHQALPSPTGTTPTYVTSAAMDEGRNERTADPQPSTSERSARQKGEPGAGNRRPQPATSRSTTGLGSHASGRSAKEGEEHSTAPPPPYAPYAQEGSRQLASLSNASGRAVTSWSAPPAIQGTEFDADPCQIGFPYSRGSGRDSPVFGGIVGHNANSPGIVSRPVQSTILLPKVTSLIPERGTCLYRIAYDDEAPSPYFHSGRIRSRPPDFKLGGICGEASEAAIANLIRFLTGFAVAAIDKFQPQLGLCSVWMEEWTLPRAVQHYQELLAEASRKLQRDSSPLQHHSSGVKPLGVPHLSALCPAGTTPESVLANPARQLERCSFFGLVKSALDDKVWMGPTIEMLTRAASSDDSNSLSPAGPLPASSDGIWLATDQRAHEFLHTYLESLKLHGPKKALFPRHTLRVSPWEDR